MKTCTPLRKLSDVIEGFEVDGVEYHRIVFGAKDVVGFVMANADDPSIFFWLELARGESFGVAVRMKEVMELLRASGMSWES